MLRFFIKCSDSYLGGLSETFYSIDCEVPELEKALGHGGRGDSGYELHHLLGVEILNSSKKESD